LDEKQRIEAEKKKNFKIRLKSVIEMLQETYYPGHSTTAKRVIEQAELHSKSIIRSPILARALYFTGNIGQAISEQLYSAVASILAYVYQLERGIDATLQEPEIPDEFIFDENGRAI